MPVLVRGVRPEKEPEWIARFVRQLSKHLHLRQSAAAVLVPTAEIGESMASALSELGLPTKYFKGRDLDLRQDVVKVISLFSGEGAGVPDRRAAVPRGLPVAEDFEPGCSPSECARATPALVAFPVTWARGHGPAGRCHGLSSSTPPTGVEEAAE